MAILTFLIIEVINNLIILRLNLGLSALERQESEKVVCKYQIVPLVFVKMGVLRKFGEKFSTLAVMSLKNSKTFSQTLDNSR